MKNLVRSYSSLSDEQKLLLLKDMYIKQKKSFADIAEEFDTYANKIRRDAKKFNIQIRDKSEAQKNALNTGKHSHPTKGKERDAETKNKIGKSVMKSWDSLDEKELNARKQKAKENWEKLSEDQKQQIQRAANEAVRVASKTGSKLEKFLLEKLIEDGETVEFHKEQSLVNTKLQVDLFLPNINVAIEVDGPSHFAPVWGEESLKKSKSYDHKKQGLILGKGWILIRIKQRKDFSKARADKIYDDLKVLIKAIASKTTSTTNFSIED